eukprot:30080-Pelagococcus_subviridis.AAC.3
MHVALPQPQLSEIHREDVARVVRDHEPVAPQQLFVPFRAVVDEDLVARFRRDARAKLVKRVAGVVFDNLEGRRAPGAVVAHIHQRHERVDVAASREAFPREPQRHRARPEHRVRPLEVVDGEDEERVVGVAERLGSRPRDRVRDGVDARQRRSRAG